MENRCSADQIPGDDIIPNEKPNAQGSPGNHPPLPPNGNMIKTCVVFHYFNVEY